MSKIKSTLAATFLTVVLAVPALAGNIGTPGYTPPPPPPETETCSTGTLVPGETDDGLTSQSLVDILIAVLSMI